MERARRRQRDPRLGRPTLPRPYAMMHIAMFDAVYSIERRLTPLPVRVPARFRLERSRPAQAAHDVLVSR
jgi:hypothetical protein